MRARHEQGWTQAEFLDWAEAQEERFEFDGFAPVAMTGGTARHSAIAGNAYFALRRRVTGSCQVFGADAGVATATGGIRYPDALVTCTSAEPESRVIPQPIVVFEVVSPSSARIDRIVKVREYGAIESIRCYVIVESALRGVTVLSRVAAGDPWTSTALSEEDTITLPGLAVELPVSELYEGIDLPD